MIPRAVLGYVLALPAIVMIVLTGIGRTRPTMVVKMSASPAAVLQVFYDTGSGFNEPQSTTVPTQASDERREYRLGLPRGEYRRFRIDPGNVPGRYAIERVAILNPDGSTALEIPLPDLTPAHELNTVARSSRQLLVDAVGNDPQLLYTRRAPLKLRSNGATLAGLWRRFAVWWIGAIGFIWLVEGRLKPLSAATVRAIESLGNRLAARPVPAISFVALIATALATYPVLFGGRTFASPNNGGAPILYSEPPFVPGSTDVEIEDARGGDVWATMLEFVPYSHVQREALAQGEVPLWNRYNAAGRPLWAQGLTFLLDPLHWLTIITRDPSLGWDLKFVAHRFVFALGVGLAAFVATGAWLPSAMVAAGTPFLGVYAYWFTHPSSFALTYAPWALWAFFRLVRAGQSAARARATTLLSVTISLVLVSSPPKQAIATLLGTAVAGALVLALVPASWGQRIRASAAAAAAGVVMLLLTAPHWLPFVDNLKQSTTLYDTPGATFAGVPAAVALFLTPMNPGPVLPGLHLVALVLGIATVTAPRRLWNHRELLAALLSSLALAAIAFGALPTSLIIRIPFIRNIIHLNDVFVAAAIPLFVITGAIGAMALLSASPAHSALVTILTLLAGWWLTIWATQLSPEGAFEPWAVLLLIIPAATLPWCLTPWQRRRTPVLSFVAAAAAFVVLIMPGGLHVRYGIPQLDALLWQPRGRVAPDRRSPAVEAVHRAAVDPARTTGLDAMLMPGTQAMYQLESLGGADALEVPAYEELVNAAGIARTGWVTTVGVADVSRLGPLLDLLNVGFVLARSGIDVPGTNDIAVAGADRLDVGQRPTAWPRAFFVDRVTSYADPADLLQIARDLNGPFAALQSSDPKEIPATAKTLVSDRIVVPADGYQLTVNTTSFHVRAPKAGLAVLSETFLPRDFRASLNGQPVRYYRVNHAFKGVRIPGAGDWYVRFEYRPHHWNLALAMAGAGFLLLLAAAFAGAKLGH